MARGRPHRSLWLHEAGVTPALDPLRGRVRADVAVVGGGYVGLWTALRIKELAPETDVVILEADVCGGGASGRNGGFVLSWWPKISSLVALCGEAEAMRLVRASEDAITTIGDFCRAKAPAADFRQAGWLWTATSSAQDGAWAGVVDVSERLRPGAFTVLEPAEVARRSGSASHLAGVLEHSGGTVHPGHLVRALRAEALDAGVRIFEHSPVRGLARTGVPVVSTASGRVVADRVVVATNAWAAGLRELHTSLFVISSDMITTAPIPGRLAEIGWTDGVGVTDSQMLVCYYRTTGAGRVAFGKGGWSIGLGGWMPPSMQRHRGRARLVEADFRRYYPMLRDVPITHDWAGPIDRSHNSLPLIDWLNRDRTIAYGVGWSGNGVGPSVVGGRVLASLALGRDDEWANCGLVGAPRRRFPPDPVRYVGAHLVREAIVRKERAEALELAPGRIATALSGLAPAGLEDKS
ncbi:MAG: FAD-dependent oxidoreductase [Streptosporangiales bacterium]|nr:FAD-dependent oxidoreductase [Streptosporangiales bacterium]